MTGGLVVVLGVTGRNFAAGMSGGIAYVYDPNNRLYSRINKELVSYSSVTSKYDEEELRAVIQKHYDHTNSEVAKDILDNFGEQVSMFKKVVPHDYRHMIELIKYYEKQGLTNEQAKVEAFNEARRGV